MSEPRRHWVVVSVLMPPPGADVLLVDALRRAGARLVERRDHRIDAHFLLPPDAAPLATAAARVARDAEAAARSAGVSDPDPSWRLVTDRDWRDALERDTAPRRVGERIVVVPATDTDTNADTGTARGTDPSERGIPGAGQAIVIRLLPGIAFGDAGHPTTRACLRRLEALVEPGVRVLDVGAGSGVLAIGAALLGARRVLGLEMDPEACIEAERNAALNGVADRVEVREAVVDARTLRGAGRYDGAVANLQSGILRPLLGPIRDTLVRGGWLVGSGVTRGERDAVVRDAGRHGLALVDEEMDGGWWTGLLSRR